MDTTTQIAWVIGGPIGLIMIGLVISELRRGPSTYGTTQCSTCADTGQYCLACQQVAIQACYDTHVDQLHHYGCPDCAAWPIHIPAVRESQWARTFRSRK